MCAEKNIYFKYRFLNNCIYLKLHHLSYSLFFIFCRSFDLTVVKIILYETEKKFRKYFALYFKQKEKTTFIKHRVYIICINMRN